MLRSFLVLRIFFCLHHRCYCQAGLTKWFFFTLLIFTAVASNAHADPLGIGKTLGFKNNTKVSVAQTSPAESIEPEVAVQKDLIRTFLAFDYSANLESDVFGAQLFTGAFAHQGPSQFNPDYAIAIGDMIQVRFWGAFEYDAVLTVDPKGNIFLPHAGPVQVVGVRNQELQRVVDAAVAKIFRTNVFSYASLNAAQPVRVFVSGFVRRPGLYNGTSMDSLLHYLDQAGGIDTDRGTFLNVLVKRGTMERANVNLYNFLLNGNLPLVQFADGDVIFVPPRQNTVIVSGLADNAKRFEFDMEERTVADLINVAKPMARATNVRIIRNTGLIKNIEYYPLDEAAGIQLENGDEIAFTADKKLGNISVRVEGEHESAQEYVMPYGTRLGSLIKLINFSDRSDIASLQLFRNSVKERQQRMLNASLQSLEQAALTARSGTSDEATLRKEEADLLLQWVKRAREIEPSGRVLIAHATNRENLLLENGDILRIPTKDGLVLISGDVLFPTAIAYDEGMSIKGYVRQAGGFAQNADSSRVVIARRDGSFIEAKMKSSGFFGSDDDLTAVNPGDEVLVLPKIDVKSRQITKDWSQIIFQMALSTGVVLAL